MGHCISNSTYRFKTGVLSLLKKSSIETVRELAKIVFQTMQMENLKNIGESPLHFVVKIGQYQFFTDVFEIIEHKIVANKNGESPLHIVAGLGYLDIFKILFTSSVTSASNGPVIILSSTYTDNFKNFPGLAKDGFRHKHASFSHCTQLSDVRPLA